MLKIKTNKIDNTMESMGLRYFLCLERRKIPEVHLSLHRMPSDEVLQKSLKEVIRRVVFGSFLIGAVTTVPAVWFEIVGINYYEPFAFYLMLSLVTLLFLVWEVTVLYYLALKGVHTLVSLSGYRENSSLPDAYDVKKMMVRSALEIEDPVIEYLHRLLLQNAPHQAALLCEKVLERV